jgi:hypothetical protein
MYECDTCLWYDKEDMGYDKEDMDNTQRNVIYVVLCMRIFHFICVLISKILIQIRI